MGLLLAAVLLGGPGNGEGPRVPDFLRPQRDFATTWAFGPYAGWAFLDEGSDHGAGGVWMRHTVEGDVGWRALAGTSLGNVDLASEVGSGSTPVQIYWLGFGPDWTHRFDGRWEFGVHGGPALFYGSEFEGSEAKLGAFAGVHGTYVLSREMSLDGFADWIPNFGQARDDGTEEINHVFLVAFGVGFRW